MIAKIHWVYPDQNNFNESAYYMKMYKIRRLIYVYLEYFKPIKYYNNKYLINRLMPILIFASLIYPLPANSSYWGAYVQAGVILGQDPCALALEAALDAYHEYDPTLEFSGCTYGGPGVSAGLAKGIYHYGASALLSCEAGEYQVNDACLSKDDGGDKSLCYSNPVDVMRGEKIETALDFSTNDVNSLKFKRFHTGNGKTKFNLILSGSLGYGWRSNYDARAYIPGSGSNEAFQATLPNGRELAFLKRTDGTWSPAYYNGGYYYNLDRKGVGDVLVMVGANMELTTTDDITYVFDGTEGGVRGRFIQVRFRGGYSQTLTYASAYDRSPASVTDSFGRTLTFSYDPQFHLTDVNYNGSSVVHFEYLGLMNTSGLTKYYPNGIPESVKQGTAVVKSVTYTTGEKVSYFYEDTNNKFALTGRTSNDGTRFATFGYDASGKAISSAHAGGVETSTFSYDQANGKVIITNPLGKQEVVTYTTSATKNLLPTSVQGQPSTNCPMSNTTMTYDANDFLASSIDAEGRKTTYVRDARGRPTSITRGAP